MKSFFKNIFLLLTVLVFVYQCTERKRLNPIDPKNPDTGGKPLGLEIYSEFDTVTLSWLSINVKNLVGYNIYRKISGQDSFSLIHLTPANSTQFMDRDVTYDLKHNYRISALTEDYESLKSDSISIVPGPTIIWATDADNRRIIKITHDGVHEIGRISVDGYPWDITIDSRDKSIWYSDLLLGRVYHIQKDTWKIYESPTTWWEPIDIALDESRKILWVADERSKIIRISPIATDSLQEIFRESFRSPNSVAVDKQSGYCWVADPMSKSVFYIYSSGRIVNTAPVAFIRPLTVAVHQAGRTCWIADSSRIVNLTSQGQFSFSINEGLRYAYALDVNQNTGEIWVIDFGISENDSRLIKFDEQGNMLFEVTGFNRPRSIAVNHYDNGCILADTGNGRIVRVSSQGEILSEIGDYYYPRGVAIEYSDNGR